MALTVRLPQDLERKIDAVVEDKGVKKSDLVRLWIEKGLEAEARQGRKTPYELWSEIFTPAGSGRGDLGRNAKRIVKEKIRASRAR
jgi:Arc/MetJ-type ribon-helix-helix transcriptional regulator